MNHLKRVVWWKGMFLTPQHFQMQDRYLEDTLQFRFQASLYANWGVTELAIDEPALANGTFALRQCRGILADGVAFSIPDVDDPPASRDLQEFFVPGAPYLDVYLALPDQRAQGKNYTQMAETVLAQQAPANTRYVMTERAVQDEVDGVEEKVVQIARKNFRLLLGDQSCDGYSTLRLAQVVRDEKGQYALRHSFAAPTLNLASSDYLMSLLRRQLELLVSKRNSISNMRRQGGHDLAEFTAAESANFFLLHTVNLFAPALEHYWSVRRGHPEPLFLTLLQLAGALATFSLDPAAHDLPPYDHNNLGTCFSALDEKIRVLLETIIPTKCVSIPLRKVDTCIWSGTVTDDKYFKDSQFFLGVGGTLGIDELIRKTPQLVKVAPKDELQNLIRLALPGITLRHAPAPPAGLVTHLNTQYFSLSQAGRLWESVVRSRAISLYVPSDIPEPKLELLVVLS
jgi:type VI secretion system protein ImpJ